MKTASSAPLSSAWAAPLTEREQQIVALAALGQHNKLIAYNLGISHSTVRVLIARAAAKVGAHSRDDVVEWFQSWSRVHGTECAADHREFTGAPLRKLVAS